jgi:hypothetical protein
MPHFGFEAYRNGFFGELLHGSGRILVPQGGSVEKMTKMRLSTQFSRIQDMRAAQARREQLRCRCGKL